MIKTAELLGLIDAMEKQAKGFGTLKKIVEAVSKSKVNLYEKQYRLSHALSEMHGRTERQISNIIRMARKRGVSDADIYKQVRGLYENRLSNIHSLSQQARKATWFGGERYGASTLDNTLFTRLKELPRLQELLRYDPHTIGRITKADAARFSIRRPGRKLAPEPLKGFVPPSAKKEMTSTAIKTPNVATPRMDVVQTTSEAANSLKKTAPAAEQAVENGTAAVRDSAARRGAEMSDVMRQIQRQNALLALGGGAAVGGTMYPMLRGIFSPAQQAAPQPMYYR